MPRRLCLVTGASAGIGAAFARVYAEAGFDLALTARRADRLETLAEGLRRDCGVQVLVLPQDLGNPGAAGRLVAAVEAQGRSVDGLVNNAGYGVPGAFDAAPWSVQATFLQVLLTSVLELTHAVVPGMRTRGYGRIVNVASLAGLTPGAAGATLYGPTKAFLVRFSQGLNTELRGTGVHVSALCPGFTRSEFHDVAGMREQVDTQLPGWVWSEAEAVARAGFASVEANRAICVPGAPNKAIALLCKLLPDEVALAMTRSQSRRFRRV